MSQESDKQMRRSLNKPIISNVHLKLRKLFYIWKQCKVAYSVNVIKFLEIT